MSPSPSRDHHYHSSSPSQHHNTAHTPNGAIIPALLMAPPTSYLGALRMSWYHFTHRFGTPTPTVFRFVLFVFKLALLARACWPGSFNVAVGGAVIIAAAVDLSWTLEGWITGFLLVLHLVFVAVLRSRAQLCQAGPELWEWNSAFHVDGGGDA